LKPQKFATLDVLRGVGAFAVMLFHFKKLLPAGELWGCVSGYLAVDLFFVLSGFVLAHAYDRRLDSTLSPAAFAIQRFARLLPMIWVGSLLGLAIGLGKGHSAAETVTSAALSLFAIPSYVTFDKSIFPLNSAEWSLFFEIFINLIFAYFFRPLRGRLLWLLVGASAVALVAFAAGFGTLSGGWEWTTFQVGFARVGFSFFLGVQLSRSFEVWSKHLPKVPAFVLVLVLMLLFEVRPSAALRPFFDLAFIVLVSPALVMLGAVAECKYERVVRFMGGMSYPLYAIHDPIVGATRGLLKKFDALAGVLPLIWVIVLPFVAYGFSVFYDAPIRAFLTQTVARGRRAMART
jgi:peptidoglycan/LPS O-acetylase OafA/YrhL